MAPRLSGSRPYALVGSVESDVVGGITNEISLGLGEEGLGTSEAYARETAALVQPGGVSRRQLYHRSDVFSHVLGFPAMPSRFTSPSSVPRRCAYS